MRSLCGNAKNVDSPKQYRRKNTRRTHTTWFLAKVLFELNIVLNCN